VHGRPGGSPRAAREIDKFGQIIAEAEKELPIAEAHLEMAQAILGEAILPEKVDVIPSNERVQPGDQQGNGSLSSFSLAVETLFNISPSTASSSIARILAGEHALKAPKPTAAEVREGVDDVAKRSLVLIKNRLFAICCGKECFVSLCATVRTLRLCGFNPQPSVITII
jgi:hypothetical protein